MSNPFHYDIIMVLGLWRLRLAPYFVKLSLSPHLLHRLMFYSVFLINLPKKKWFFFIETNTNLYYFKDDDEL